MICTQPINTNTPNPPTHNRKNLKDEVVSLIYKRKQHEQGCFSLTETLTILEKIKEFNTTANSTNTTFEKNVNDLDKKIKILQAIEKWRYPYSKPAQKSLARTKTAMLEEIATCSTKVQEQFLSLIGAPSVEIMHKL